MATTFALMIQPAEADADRTDFADTFASVDPEAPALSVGELSTQRGDGIFERGSRSHPRLTSPRCARTASVL